MIRDSSKSHIYKISKRLIDKHIQLAHKEIGVICISDA